MSEYKTVNDLGEFEFHYWNVTISRAIGVWENNVISISFSLWNKHLCKDRLNQSLSLCTLCNTESHSQRLVILRFLFPKVPQMWLLNDYNDFIHMQLIFCDVVNCNKGKMKKECSFCITLLDALGSVHSVGTWACQCSILVDSSVPEWTGLRSRLKQK